MKSRVESRMPRRRFRGPKGPARWPRLATLVASGALVAAAGIGGWMVYGQKQTAEPVTLTSAKPVQKVRLPAPPAPAELQTKLAALATAYREPVGIAVTDVTERW